MKNSILTAVLTTSLLSVCTTFSSQISAGTRSVVQPATMCRAAVEKQDSLFRLSNSRIKNVSGASAYIICPVPHITDSPYNKDVEVYLVNEGPAVVSVKCNLYGHKAPYGQSQFTPSQVPTNFTSGSMNVASGMGGTLTLSAGTPNNLSWNSGYWNLVCLVPPKTSVMGYYSSHADFYF